MPSKRVTLSIGALLGNLEGVRLRDFLEKSKSISEFLSWTQRTFFLKSGGHLDC
jgi:hypothetical protein